MEVRAREAVLHPERDPYLQPADGLDHPRDAPERGHGPVVDPRAEVLLDRLHHARRSAARHRGVDLGRAQAGDRDQRVARDADDRPPAASARMQEDHVDRVRPRGERVLPRPGVRSDREDRDRSPARSDPACSRRAPARTRRRACARTRPGARRSIRSSSPRPRRGARTTATGARRVMRPASGASFRVTSNDTIFHAPPTRSKKYCPTDRRTHLVRARRDRGEPHDAHEQHGRPFAVEQDPRGDPARPRLDPLVAVPGAGARREQPGVRLRPVASAARESSERVRVAPLLPVRRIEEPLRVQIREHVLGRGRRGDARLPMAPADPLRRGAHQLARGVREPERGRRRRRDVARSSSLRRRGAPRRGVVPREDDEGADHAAAPRVRHR